MADLKPPEVGQYAEQALGRGGTARGAERLQEVRKFLTFAKKQGLTEVSLAPHLRIPKAARARKGPQGDEPEPIQLSPEGHKQLLAELSALKDRRAPIAVEIRTAAADKDVRENAPLEAAREQLGHVESRIRQIETTIKASIVVSSTSDGKVISVGSKVTLKDLSTGRELKYTLVGALEANPLGRKFSDVSPVGKASLKHTAGQEFDVATPRGKQRYKILRVR